MKIHSLLAIFVFLLLCHFCPQTYAADIKQPQRIVSLGLCTDQLLLMLVDPARIASLSYFAADANMSYMVDSIGNIPLNNTSAEAVIPYQPDLVVSSQYASRETIKLLRQLGYNVQLISLPNTVSGIKNLLQEFGQWVAAEDQAENLIREMDKRISTIQNAMLHKTRKSVVIYSPNGYTIGADTLEHDILEYAGYRNLSAEMGIKGFEKIPLEKLIASNPDYLQIDSHVFNQNSLANAYINHPALHNLLSKEKRLFIPSRLRACPGPMVVEAIEYMARRL